MYAELSFFLLLMCYSHAGLIWQNCTGSILLRSEKEGFIGTLGSKILILGGLNTIIEYNVDDQMYTDLATDLATSMIYFGYQAAQSSSQHDDLLYMIRDSQKNIDVFNLTSLNVTDSFTGYNGSAERDRCLVYYKEFLMIIGGGSGHNDFILYDIANNAWYNGPSFPTIITGASCNVVGDILYVIGGRSGVSSNGDLVRTINISLVPNITEHWKTMSDTLSVERERHRSVVVDQLIYVVGSYGIVAVDIIDTISNKIYYDSNLLYAKSGLSLIAVKHRLFAFGGYPFTYPYCQYAFTYVNTTAPTRNPSLHPTESHPTKYPTKHPTKNPTQNPSENPSSLSSSHPTHNTIHPSIDSTDPYTSVVSTSSISQISGCLPTNACLNNGRHYNFGPIVNSQTYLCNDDGTISNLIYNVANCKGQEFDSITGKIPYVFENKTYSCSTCDNYIKYKYWDIRLYDDTDCSTRDSVDWYEWIEPMGNTDYGVNTCTDEEITIHSLKMRNGCNLNTVTTSGKTIERWMQIEIQHCPGYEIKTNSVGIDGVDASKNNSNINYPLVTCISAIFLLFSLACCLFSFLRKASEKVTKYLSISARTIIVVSLLAEDIFALLWQKPTADDRNIFWIFYGFACLVGLIEICTLSSKLVYCGFVVLIEIGQSILFMWICNWEFLPVYTFLVFFIVQILLECVTFFCERSSNPDGYPASNANIKQGVTTVTVKCGVSIIAGIGVMPFVYYGEETPFRTQWFDIFVTTVIWFSILSGTIMAQTSLNPKIYDVVIVCIMCVGFATLGVVWILSIIYLIKLAEWQPGFEYGYTMFMIVMVPTCICGFPCCVIRLYSKMQDRLAEQMNDVMNTNADQ